MFAYRPIPRTNEHVMTMKCKQGADPAQAAKLGYLVHQFEHAYLGAARTPTGTDPTGLATQMPV
jgi:hypothetical protein